MRHTAPGSIRFQRLAQAVLAIALSLGLADPGAFSALAQVGRDAVADQLLEVQGLIGRNNLPAARARLEELIRQFPGDPRAFNFLGVVQAQLDDRPAAEKSFLRALEIAPRFLGALLNLGRLYQEDSSAGPERLDRALQVYQQAVAIDPRNLEAVFQLGRLQLMAGDFSSSERTLENLPADSRQRTPVLALNCGNHAGLGRSVETAACIEQLKSAPGLLEADALQILDSLRSAGKLGDGIQLLERLKREGNLSLPGMESLAYLYDETGDFEGAELLLSSLTGHHPDLPSLLVKMAWIAYRNRKYETALGYLAHARDLRQNDARIHLFFGLTCIELNLTAEAMRSMEQALALEPENLYFTYAFGITVMRWREAAEALPYLTKYVEARPEDPMGQAALGEALFLNKDYPAARKRFEPLAAVPQTKVAANFYLGVMDRLEQDFDSAMSRFQTVLTEKPDHADALAELGSLYTRLRKFEEAEQALGKALTLEKEHYQAHFNLLTLYSRARDPRYEAQKEYFEKIKEARWQRYSESLRTIEVVPHQLFPQLEFSGVPKGGAN